MQVEARDRERDESACMRRHQDSFRLGPRVVTHMQARGARPVYPSYIHLSLSRPVLSGDDFIAQNLNVIDRFQTLC